MNIPPPNNSFSIQPSHFTSGGNPAENYVSNPAVDPSLGWGYGQSAYGPSGAYQLYQQYMAMAYQNLNNPFLDPTERQAWGDYLNQLNQWLGQYQDELSLSHGADLYGMNPEMDMGMGLTGNPLPNVVYQDSNHVVIDDTDTTTLTLDQDFSESRLVDIYPKNNTVIVPSNAANVSVVSKADDAVPGKTMIIVIYTCNGKTHTLQYHNVEREGFKLNIQTPDKSQVIFDATLGAFAAKVKVGEIGEETKTQGTPADEIEGDTRTWNTNESVDYYATEGSEIDEIYAHDVNITLENFSQKAEVTKTGDHEYTVAIKDKDGTVIRTIHLYQVKSLNFHTVSGENLFYKDATGNSPDADFKAWNDPSCSKDSQITVSGEEGASEGALNPEHPEDSVPSSKEEFKAYYEKDENVSLHTNVDDEVENHYVTAGGTVDLYGLTQADTAFVDYIDGKIHVTITTKDQDGNVKSELYVIDPMMDQINIHLDPSKITYSSTIPSEVAEKIMDGDGKAANGGLDNSILTGLLSKYSEEEVIEAMEKAGVTAEELQELPMPPTGNIIQFLRDLDSELDGLLKNTGSLSNVPGNKAAREAANDKLAALLSDLGYDAKRFKNNPFDHYMTYSEGAGIMMINGIPYMIFDESANIGFTGWHFNPGEAHQEVDPNTGIPTGVTSWYDYTNHRWQSDKNDAFKPEMVTKSQDPENDYYSNGYEFNGGIQGYYDQGKGNSEIDFEDGDPPIY